jgi:uncharacterized membrane protein YedE/YeeE
VVVVAAAMLVLSAVRLALPGQRRGQCSTLFTWADLNGRPVLTCAAFPRQRWPSGRPRLRIWRLGFGFGWNLVG